MSNLNSISPTGRGAVKLFTTFFRIGLTSIGGGFATRKLIEREVKVSNDWISEEDFPLVMEAANRIPGVFAINASVIIGYKVRGRLGAAVCCLGAALPSLIIMLCLAVLFQSFHQHEAFEKIFRGIRPALAALMTIPVFRIAREAKINRYTIWVPVLAALAIRFMGISPIYVIIAAAIGGYIYGQAVDQ